MITTSADSDLVAGTLRRWAELRPGLYGPDMARYSVEQARVDIAAHDVLLWQDGGAIRGIFFVHVTDYADRRTGGRSPALRVALLALDPAQGREDTLGRAIDELRAWGTKTYPSVGRFVGEIPVKGPFWDYCQTRGYADDERDGYRVIERGEGDGPG